MNQLKSLNFIILMAALVATLTLGACGREGTVYGTLNNSYVEINDSVSAYSTLYDPYSSSAGYSQTVYGSGGYTENADLIVYIGDGSEGFILELTIANIYSITCGTNEPLGYNINMELVMADGTRYIATSGEVLFDLCGMYNGEKIGGYFQAYFTAGELYGDFQTNIGY